MLISATIPTGRFDAGGIVGFVKISNVSQFCALRKLTASGANTPKKGEYLMARRIKRLNQKQQKNLVAVGAGLVGASAVALATYPQWTVPAVGATHTYADVHNAVGDFISYTSLDNGMLILAGIVFLGVAAFLFRK